MAKFEFIPALLPDPSGEAETTRIIQGAVSRQEGLLDTDGLTPVLHPQLVITQSFRQKVIINGLYFDNIFEGEATPRQALPLVACYPSSEVGEVADLGIVVDYEPLGLQRGVVVKLQDQTREWAVGTLEPLTVNADLLRLDNGITWGFKGDEEYVLFLGSVDEKQAVDTAILAPGWRDAFEGGRLRELPGETLVVEPVVNLALSPVLVKEGTWVDKVRELWTDFPGACFDEIEDRTMGGTFSSPVLRVGRQPGDSEDHALSGRVEIEGGRVNFQVDNCEPSDITWRLKGAVAFLEKEKGLPIVRKEPARGEKRYDLVWNLGVLLSPARIEVKVHQETVWGALRDERILSAKEEQTLASQDTVLGILGRLQEIDVSPTLISKSPEALERELREESQDRDWRKRLFSNI